MNDAGAHEMRSGAPSSISRASHRLFTIRSGGWVLLLAGSICLAVMIWALAPAVMRSISRPPGDGRTIESYAFDLSNVSIPRDEILTNVMKHRDMVPVMFNPTHSGPSSADVHDPERWRAMQHRNDLQYGKYLVPDDRVIGVAINGEARCYPISVMNVHEVINDTLGQPAVPIAVTYNWPCDAVIVLDRRVESEGEARSLEFGISGLVYNSDTLLYDVRRANAAKQTNAGEAAVGGESLFCPLLARGVSGRFADMPLKIVSASLTTWREWSASHPQTTVLDRNLSMAKRYKDAAPTKYFQDPKPLRPVKPAPPDDGWPAKTPVIIVQTNGDGSAASRRVFAVPTVLALADADGVWNSAIGGTSVRFTVNRAARTIVAESDQPITVMYAFWFAWHAMHPDDRLFEPDSDQRSGV
jgi:hypothetical protein